ncbi:hypothetical protein DVA76_19300, partial [Acinetobacter baumannii]
YFILIVFDNGTLQKCIVLRADLAVCCQWASFHFKLQSVASQSKTPLSLFIFNFYFQQYVAEDI